MIDLGQVAQSYAALDGAELLEPLIREAFPGRIALVSSFGAESAALLSLVAEIDRRVPVIFLDTEKLFPETLAYRDALVARLKLADVRTIRPDPDEVELLDPGGDLWSRDGERCCALRKVEPLERALRGFRAWISGRKHYHGGARSRMPVIEVSDWRLKINPLARWDRQRIERYLQERDLPRHPLVARGYPSIGCMPCTSPADAADDVRAGRWSGSSKTECGIHWTVNGQLYRPAAGRAA